MILGEASVPDGLRVYAIGDVHGRDDLLGAVHAAVEADLAARPVGDHRLIHLGDYIDRGPATAAVIERLSSLSARDGRVICLRGNHEDALFEFLADPEASYAFFARFGGLDTIASYGAGLLSDWPASDARRLRDRFLAELPPAHRAFLEGLADSHLIGDYFFCHAGIRPGVPLDRQAPRDLHWIREEFLTSRADHGAIIVHGHTPVKEPDIAPNRIGIDTGAVFTGRLTCLVLEGTGYRFLSD